MAEFYAFAFEANAIQNYLFRSSRLRYVIGASELLEQSCTELVDDILSVLSAQADTLEFARRAGGSLVVLSSDKAALESFASVWSLAIRSHMPHLSYSQALSDAHATKFAAAKQVINQLRAARSSGEAFPAPRPTICAPCPRTGLPAVKPTGLAEARLPDADMLRQEAARRSRSRLTAFFTDDDQYQWPVDFSAEEFPYLNKDEESQKIAYVHIDGDGIGGLIFKISEYAERNPDDYPQVFLDFSDTLTQIGKQAARQAFTKILESAVVNGNVPARPLVCGGDDLSIVIRADLAVPFTHEYLRAFEQFSVEALAPLKAKYSFFPSRFSSCGGIAFCGSQTPFNQAVQLADELCSFAKAGRKDAQAETGYYAYLDVVDGMQIAAQQRLQTELSFVRDGQPHCLSQQPYAIASAAGAEPNDSQRLLGTIRFLQEHSISTNGLRALLREVQFDPEKAEQMYTRWWQVQSSELPNDADDLASATLLSKALFELRGGVYRSAVHDIARLIDKMPADVADTSQEPQAREQQQEVEPA